jgi:hypothetical protein
MRFGIFGAAQAGSPRPGGPMGQGFHDFIAGLCHGSTITAVPRRSVVVRRAKSRA